MALPRPFKEDVERFLFPRLSPPGDRWRDVLGFEPAGLCSDLDKRRHKTRLQGKGVFSQLLKYSTPWRTRERHWSTSIQHAVSSTNTLHCVEDT